MAAISFTWEILSAELVMLLNFNLHLFDLQIFFITISQEARRGKSWGGTSMRASKWILQSSVLSRVHCLQTNQKIDGENAHSSWL